LLGSLLSPGAQMPLFKNGSVPVCRIRYAQGPEEPGYRIVLKQLPMVTRISISGLSPSHVSRTLQLYAIRQTITPTFIIKVPLRFGMDRSVKYSFLPLSDDVPTGMQPSVFYALSSSTHIWHLNKNMTVDDS